MRMKIKKADERQNKKCGMITCIHCICNTCTIEKCDFYERYYIQED
jgi:hypothetical protein